MSERKKRDRVMLSFSLAELQLLALGLWVIGDENRVDWKLMPDYKQLRVDIQRGLQRQADLAGHP